MSYTKNYNLETYSSNDVTDWLGAFNKNMNKIDSQMYINAQNIEAVDVKADNNNTQIGILNQQVQDLNNITQGSETDISGLDTSLKALTQTVNQNVTHINENTTRIDALENSLGGNSFTVNYYFDAEKTSLFTTIKFSQIQGRFYKWEMNPIIFTTSILMPLNEVAAGNIYSDYTGTIKFDGGVQTIIMLTGGANIGIKLYHSSNTVNQLMYQMVPINKAVPAGARFWITGSGTCPIY